MIGRKEYLCCYIVQLLFRYFHLGQWRLLPNTVSKLRVSADNACLFLRLCFEPSNDIIISNCYRIESSYKPFCSNLLQNFERLYPHCRLR